MRFTWQESLLGGFRGPASGSWATKLSLDLSVSLFSFFAIRQKCFHPSRPQGSPNVFTPQNPKQYISDFPWKAQKNAHLIFGDDSL